MKYITTAFLFLATMCDNNDTELCEAALPNPDVVCYEIYDPVCGCNNVTYANTCYAEASKVPSWTKGACETNLP